MLLLGILLGGRQWGVLDLDHAEGLFGARAGAASARHALEWFDVGGMSELIEPNRSGWLVPIGQPHRLAETIVAALLDGPGRRRVGQAARETIVEHYTTERWVDCYATLYRRMAD